MGTRDPSAADAAEQAPQRAGSGVRLRLCLAVLCAGGASALFLRDWAAFALNSQLYSHVLLIPFVTAWLLGRRWGRLAVIAPAPALLPALIGLAGAGLLSFWAYCPMSPCGPQSAEGRIAGGYLSAVLLFYAGTLAALGPAFFRAALFPLLFLLSGSPFPPLVEAALEDLLQHGSAEVAGLLFEALPIPFFREGLVFYLPGLTMEVAPECSGIHSTIVLFVVSLLAGELFLTSASRRWLLALLVLPLGMARNAFRILTLGVLTVYVDPGVIHSPLHHRGGPIFFGVSLVVFLGIVIAFKRGERKGGGGP